MENNLKVNSNEIGQRLREAREHKRLIRSDACKLLNVSKSTLQAWENGSREMSVSQLADAANIYDVSIQWIINGQKKNATEATKILNNHSNFVLIPRYDIQILADGSYNSIENTEFGMIFRRSWLENDLKVTPEYLSLIEVKGDSMKEILNDKDIILVNRAENDPQEGIYVLKIDGHLLVKQLQRLPDLKVKVMSKNTDYDPFTIDLKNSLADFEIIGKVIWYGRVF